MKTNAITLLKKDHAKVKKLLGELEKAQKASRRADLLAQIAVEVTVHTTIEEEIFYPAFREAGRTKTDGTLFFEAHAEHNVVRIVLPDLEMTEPDSEEFAGKAKVLKEMIEHHAEEEEKELFPRAKTLLSEEELEDLGERLAERKRELAAVGVKS